LSPTRWLIRRTCRYDASVAQTIGRLFTLDQKDRLLVSDSFQHLDEVIENATGPIQVVDPAAFAVWSLLCKALWIESQLAIEDCTRVVGVLMYRD
jgi:hypothetical protein